MPIKLMYITNDLEIAKIADSNDIDWIFIDLEYIGKEERQKNMDTVKSKHSISDIKKIKPFLINSKMLVRVNPINEKSEIEIEQVIQAGTDIIMLPFFKTLEEINMFLDYVGGRAQTCLLLETPEAVEIAENIAKVNGIDYIHIGLNDLHIGYEMGFMFEVLTKGIVERLANIFNKNRIIFGFGGIATLGKGLIDSRLILAEHYRLNSNMAILSRSFYNNKKSKLKYDEINNYFHEEVKKIREYESFLLKLTHTELRMSHKELVEKVDEVINEK